jgi:hypothetical protein
VFTGPRDLLDNFDKALVAAGYGPNG